MKLNYSRYKSNSYLLGCECLIYEAYDSDCKEIAEECVREGYPSHGENYDLRLEEWWLHDYEQDAQYLESEARPHVEEFKK